MNSTQAVPRPIGVTILSWLHIVAGSVAALWVVYAFVRHAAETGSSGLPLFVLLEIVAVVFVGVGVGVAMLQGRGWSWYVVTFLYLLGSGASVMLLYMAGDTAGTARVARLASRFGVAPGALLAVPVIAALAGVALYAYFFTHPPRAHFRLHEQSRWFPLGVQPGIVVAIFVIVALLVQPSAPPEDIEGNSNALQALGQTGADTDDQLKFMIEHLEGGIQRERVSAAWAMGQSGRADAVPHLLTAARDDSDRDVRINAIDSLAKIGGEGVQQALLDFLAEDDVEIQSIVLMGLADERYAGAFREVGEMLRSESDRIRANAADALGAMGKPETVPLLMEAAADPATDVRSRAAFALGKLGDPRGVPALIAMAKDSSWEVRGNAVQALGMVGDASGRQAVEALLDDPNSQVRFAAEQALSELD